MGEQKEANLMNVSQTFNIEAGVLEDALDNYSEVTGIKTVYLNELVAGKKSPGVQGIYSSEAAVKKMLKGTGLTYQVTAENTVVLKKNKMVVAQREGEKTEPVEKKEKARRPVEIEQMTVTAQKQEENVQEVPMSITVFDSLDIEDKKIESIRDMADFVITAAPESFRVSTGLYVDGVPVLTGIGFVNEMLDIERIEVLRGPQGTIYGKGTEAGAINIITRQPDNEFRGKVSAQGGKLLSGETGDKEKGEFSLNLSGPIQKDRLFFSIAGKYYQKDGFIENTMTGDDVDDRERWFGRAHLRWTPVDDLDISLIASRLEYDDGDANMNMGENGAAMFGLPAPEDRKVTSNMEGENNSSNDSQSLKIAYDISESLTLTSITTNWVYEDEGFADFDFSPATLMHSDKDSEYSKVGLYYDRDVFDVDYEVTSVIPQMAGVTSRDVDGHTYAVFANLTYPLTKRLSLITGLRYEKEEQDFEDNISHQNSNASWDELSPKIALEYCFTPAIMTYVSASQGYRSGGFNWTAKDPHYISYDEEKLWSYEIGAKSAFLDNRLIINGSAYYMKIDDMQVNEAVSPMESYITNAAEATGKGVELEIRARPYDGLSLMAGFGYSDIEFDSFKDVLGDYEGNENPWSPEYTFNIGAQYRHESGFYVRADLIGYGKMYFDKANDYSRDAYEIVNAKIGYEAEDFDIYLYGKNLFDKEYDSDGYYGGMYTIYSDPGEVGLQAVYRF
jgi:iron complex outermembrane receptor protein